MKVRIAEKYLKTISCTNNGRDKLKSANLTYISSRNKGVQKRCFTGQDKKKVHFRKHRLNIRYANDTVQKLRHISNNYPSSEFDLLKQKSKSPRIDNRDSSSMSKLSSKVLDIKDTSMLSQNKYIYYFLWFLYRNNISLVEITTNPNFVDTPDSKSLLKSTSNQHSKSIVIHRQSSQPLVDGQINHWSSSQFPIHSDKNTILNKFRFESRGSDPNLHIISSNNVPKFQSHHSNKSANINSTKQIHKATTKSTKKKVRIKTDIYKRFYTRWREFRGYIFLKFYDIVGWTKISKNLELDTTVLICQSSIKC